MIGESTFWQSRIEQYIDYDAVAIHPTDLTFYALTKFPWGTKWQDCSGGCPVDHRGMNSLTRMTFDIGAETWSSDRNVVWLQSQYSELQSNSEKNAY